MAFAGAAATPPATSRPTTAPRRPPRAPTRPPRGKCDALNGNAKDICVAEAKAARTRTDEEAEAAYKDTPKAREHAIHEIAEADYKVAKERCDDKTGNDKDVCVKDAKAALVKAKADAKATRVSTDAKMDASKDKREADYKVAAEKCDAMSGDAKGACVKAAKAQVRRSKR